jgi:hypothetical protein
MRKTTTQSKKASGDLVPMTIQVLPSMKADLEHLAEKGDMSLSKAVAFILSVYLFQHQRFAGSFEQKAEKVFQEEFAGAEAVCLRGIENLTSFVGNIPKKVCKRKAIN